MGRREVAKMIDSDSKTARQEGTGVRVWDRIMRKALSLRGVNVDRASFLSSQLRSHCNETQVQRAIEERPANAGIPSDLIDELADTCIKFHVRKAAASSFVITLPGGWVTTPVDRVQFYWNAIVLSQKLAYLYGWSDLLMKKDEADEEIQTKIILFIGVMEDVAEANETISEVAKGFAQKIVGDIPMMALTNIDYPLIKRIGKRIGISITKKSFLRYLVIGVPIVGGISSARETAARLKPMGRRLKGYLRELIFAHPDGHDS